MHIPPKFKESDVELLHNLIVAHPLGAWAALTDQGIDVNHIPFVLHQTRSELGILAGHVNRANPIWRTLIAEEKSIVVFQGPETYITPSWYPSKSDHGKVVPTWNYVVVHAHGVARIIDDADWLMNQLNALTDEQEKNKPTPWQVNDAPQDYIDKMLKGIVGIEIEITALEGAWKASQNKAQTDREGVVQGLGTADGTHSKSMAEIVSSRL